MRMHVHLKTFAVTWVTLVTKTYEWSWANSRPHESQWSSSSKIEFKVELDFDSKYTEVLYLVEVQRWMLENESTLSKESKL